MFKCFNNLIPLHILPNILNEEVIEVKTGEIVNDKDFEKTDTEIETYESFEELKFPQKAEFGGVLILDDINEKK